MVSLKLLDVITGQSTSLTHSENGHKQWILRQPGKPIQNAYIERFNRTARNEWLNMHIFDSVEHAQNLATQWMWVYNNERPYSSIGGTPPRKLLEAI